MDFKIMYVYVSVVVIVILYGIIFFLGALFGSSIRRFINDHRK